jgi:hypothetical protein
MAEQGNRGQGAAGVGFVFMIDVVNLTISVRIDASFLFFKKEEVL